MKFFSCVFWFIRKIFRQLLIYTPSPSPQGTFVIRTQMREKHDDLVHFINRLWNPAFKWFREFSLFYRPTLEWTTQTKKNVTKVRVNHASVINKTSNLQNILHFRKYAHAHWRHREMKRGHWSLKDVHWPRPQACDRKRDSRYFKLLGWYKDWFWPIRDRWSVITYPRVDSINVLSDQYIPVWAILTKKFDQFEFFKNSLYRIKIYKKIQLPYQTRYLPLHYTTFETQNTNQEALFAQWRNLQPNTCNSFAKERLEQKTDHGSMLGDLEFVENYNRIAKKPSNSQNTQK